MITGQYLSYRLACEEDPLATSKAAYFYLQFGWRLIIYLDAQSQLAKRPGY